MVRRLKFYPEDKEILTKTCEEVKNFDPELGTVALDMMTTMRAKHGQGLAAPQIGDIRRIIVVQLSVSNAPIVMVNPVFKAWSENYQIIGKEGCLSLPDLWLRIKRYHMISVDFQDCDGILHNLNLYDNDARVVQHEMDHLNGVLIIDRVPKVIARAALEKYRKSRRYAAPTETQP